MCSRSDLALIRPSAAAPWWEKSSPQHCSAGAVCTRGCWCASPGGVSRGLPPSQPLHRWHTRVPSCPTEQDAFPKKSKKRLRKTDCTTRRTETVRPPACGWHCVASLTLRVRLWLLSHHHAVAGTTALSRGEPAEPIGSALGLDPSSALGALCRGCTQRDLSAAGQEGRLC